MACSKDLPLRFDEIPANELRLAEYCYSVELRLDKWKNESLHSRNLCQFIVALANGIGGIIHVRCSQDNGSAQATDVIKSFYKFLENIFLKERIHKCVQIECSSQKGKAFVIYVKRCTTLITRNSHMYHRHLESTIGVNDANNIESIITQKPIAPIFSFEYVDSFQNGEVCEQVENEHLEYKHSTKYLTELKNDRNYFQRIKETLFAFTNTPGGGTMVIGVKDKTREIQGIKIKSEKDKEDFTNTFSELLVGTNTKYGKTPIWVNTHRKPILNKDWYIKFVPVVTEKLQDSQKERFVVIIHIRHCPGGVWAACPESFKWCNVNDPCKQLSFRDWRGYFTQNTEQCSIFEEDSQIFGANDLLPTFSRAESQPSQTLDIHEDSATESSTEEANSNDQLKAEPLQVTLHQAKDEFSENSDYTLDMIDFDESEDEAAQNPLSRTSMLAWTQNRESWSENIAEASDGQTLVKNINELAPKLDVVKKKNPVNFTPQREMILQSCNNIIGINEVVKCIEKSLANTGFAIASRYWTDNLKLDNDFLDPTENHLFDVFAVDGCNNIHIFSVFSRDEQRDLQWTYLMLIGRITKENLLSSSDSLSFSVFCHLLHSSTPDSSGITCDLSQTHLLANNSELCFEELQRHVTKLLLVRDTFVKDRLGDQMLVQLTSTQLTNILNMDFAKFVLTQGPPGSGKTYIAWDICARHQGKTTFICTTPTFKKFIDFQMKAEGVIVKTGADIDKLLDDLAKKDHTCIIIDDAHNLKCEKDSWIKLFTFVHVRKDLKLFIFMDSDFQNYKDGSESLELKILLMTFCSEKYESSYFPILTDVLRNTQKVMSFFKACIEDDPNLDRIKCTHGVQGDDVLLLHLKNIRENTMDNELVQHIKDLTSPKCTNRLPQYEPRDIAILLDSGNAEDDAILYKTILEKQLDVKVHRATVYPTEGLVVETLDNFMGLEAKVCMFITSTGMLAPRSEAKKRRSVLNPKFKAFISSRGVSRVEFITDGTINNDLFTKFNFNKLPTRGNETKLEEKIPANAMNIPRKWNKAMPGTDLAFYTCMGQKCLLVVNQGKLDVIDVDTGRDLEHSFDAEEVLFDRVSVSPDNTYAVVTYPRRGTDWMWRIYNLQGFKWEQHGDDHELDRQAWGIDWTSDNHIVIIDKSIQEGITSLSRHDMEGRNLWVKMGKDTNISRPERMAAGKHDTLYVMDYGNDYLRAFTPNGELAQSSDVSSQVLKKPQAICASRISEVVLVSHSNVNGVTDVSVLTAQKRITLLHKSVRVNALAMFEDAYVAVGTDKRVFLYDITSLF